MLFDLVRSALKGRVQACALMSLGRAFQQVHTYLD